MGERPPTKFQRVRAAVMANTEAAGRVDPPLRTPEARVHGVVMLLFLGWGKFEDRIAVSYIAQRCGWWDGTGSCFRRRWGAIWIREAPAEPLSPKARIR